MTMPGNQRLEPDLDLSDVLRSAHVALDCGDIDEANRLARGVLQQAEVTGDAALQARALTLLAHSDRLTSKFRRALDASQQAAFLFRLCNDPVGEVGALATQCYVASSLGRNEEAVEAALLGVQLGTHLEAGPQLAMSYNNLGVAYFWSRDFYSAGAAFDKATALARKLGSPVVAFHPQLNRVAAEALRLVTERFHTGRLPCTKQICQWMDTCERGVGEDTFVGLAEGMQVSAKSVQLLFTGVCRCWVGDLAGATSAVDVGLQWAEKYPGTTWLQLLERWIRAEIAWAQGDLAHAQVFAQNMLSLSVHIEHEQLAGVAHLLLAQLHQIQGRPLEALDELKGLRRREERIRIDSLQSRGRVVSWQLDIRQHEQSLRTLTSSSQLFEKLSNEDPLTGLGNRRFFEHRAKEHLANCERSSQPLCLALLDVDQFKQVNDKHSHSVGDRVLQAIGNVLRQCIREQDVPARLAGDEFVIVLPNADAHVAEKVCARVCSGVEKFDWSTLAPGLQVRVSTGMVRAEPGESYADLLHRSDLAMYATKHQQPRSKSIIHRRLKSSRKKGCDYQP